MSKVIRVGLFGVSLESVNYGVTALAITQIQMLQRIACESNKKMEYWIFADDSESCIEEIKQSLKIDHIEAKYIVRIKTGLPGLLKLKRDICQCDVIIDLTYGDSFSDIYGIKSFYLYSLPKLVAIWCKKRLVLGPQTIGPFYNKAVEKTAKFILKRADHVYARDEASLACAKALAAYKDIRISSDLAMELEYPVCPSPVKYDKNRLSVGLNISQLMWNKNAENSNIGVRLSYRELVHELLKEFQKRNVSVHLIAHVYDKKEYNEYSLAAEIHSKYENTVLAPKFSGPVDAKTYMAQLDLFIGSRMHATIGAFSAGVPVIPISYSRKFEGLYGSIGYDYCIDCSKESVSSAVEKILGFTDDIEKLQVSRDKAFALAKKRNESYAEVMRELLS